jgi:hypothetical protein
MRSKLLNTIAIIIVTILVVPLVGISSNSIISINKSYAQLTTTRTTVSPGISTSSIPNSSPSPLLNSVTRSSTLSSPLTSTATTTTTTTSSTTSLIPPSAIPAISAKWATWVLPIPTPNNPLPDTTGANCAVNQNNNIPFWFLVGKDSTFQQPSTVTRTCTTAIPKDRFIFFPVANSIVTDIDKNLMNNPPGDIRTEQALAKQLADAFVVSSLRASVDNRLLSSSDIHRAQSVPFSYITPQNNIQHDPPGFATGSTDGYWVILNPLPVGQHTIHFSAQANAIPVFGIPAFSVDVIYHITVR